MMRCAEVTLLNLTRYISNEHPEYRTVLPSEISARANAYTRGGVVPSRGLTYDTIGSVLSDFGVSVSFCTINDVNEFCGRDSGVSSEVALKRLLYRYVRSGIPVAINVGDSRHPLSEGHSLICVGCESNYDSGDVSEGDAREASLEQLKEDSIYRNALLSSEILNQSLIITCRDKDTNRRNRYVLIDGGDFPREYVVMDDSQQPYSLRSFEHLTLRDDYSCLCFIIPNHNMIMLNAMDAHAEALALLNDDSVGLATLSDGIAEEYEHLVLELFVTSSEEYKYERRKNERKQAQELQVLRAAAVRKGDTAEVEHLMELINAHEALAMVYETAEFPRFVWVAELTRLRYYRSPCTQQRVFSEVVLDAGPGEIYSPFHKLVLIRHPDRLYYRDAEGHILNLTIDPNAMDSDGLIPYMGSRRHVQVRH